jgi:hypothetical protein
MDQFDYIKELDKKLINISNKYHQYKNKYQKKSIKLIKCIDNCSEDDIKNKFKELEDTNKDLLLKMDEMNAKHNELVNKLLDRIIELGGKN